MGDGALRGGTVEPGDPPFEELRPLLLSIAYRMLGSFTDAEDIVQDAYLRWTTRADRQVRSPKAYLTTAVTRLCIDHQRARGRHRTLEETWLPEPWSGSTEAAGPHASESLSTAFLLLLQSLSPVERAVFLLRTVFDCDYSEISGIVGKGEENCRQIARRARDLVVARRPRFEVSRQEQDRLVREFANASASGDLERLKGVLSDDATLRADAGGRKIRFGKVQALSRPILGRERVARFLALAGSQRPAGFEVRTLELAGRPALAGYAGGAPFSVITFDFAGDRIRGVFILNDPEKLGHLPPLQEN